MSRRGKSIKAYAVIRRDPIGEASPESANPVSPEIAGGGYSYTVKEIVLSEEVAEREVERLNLLNADKGCIYLWTGTRAFLDGGSCSEDPAVSDEQDQKASWSESVPPVPDFLIGRTFRPWVYTVSHSSLLFRSVISQAHPSRVDLTFVGVGYSQYTAAFTLRSFTTLDPGESTTDCPYSPNPDERLFRMESDVGTFFIAAMGCGAAEDEEDSCARSPFDFFLPAWEP